MRRPAILFLLIILGLSVGCRTVGPTVGVQVEKRSSVSAMPKPGIDKLPYDLIGCEGLEVLDHPVDFYWPSIEKNLHKVEESSWGYFHCKQSQAAVAALQREKLPLPPLYWQEIQWVDQEAASLGVYFFEPSQSWLYVWFVYDTQSTDASYLVMARGKAGLSGDWACWLWQAPRARQSIGLDPAALIGRRQRIG